MRFGAWFFEAKKLLSALDRLPGLRVFAGDLAKELELEAADCRTALGVVTLDHDAELLPGEELDLLQSNLGLGNLLVQAHKAPYFMLKFSL